MKLEREDTDRLAVLAIQAAIAAPMSPQKAMVLIPRYIIEEIRAAIRTAGYDWEPMIRRRIELEAEIRAKIQDRQSAENEARNATWDAERRAELDRAGTRT